MAYNVASTSIKNPSDRPWRATCHMLGMSHHLGFFETLEQADFVEREFHRRVMKRWGEGPYFSRETRD